MFCGANARGYQIPTVPIHHPLLGGKRYSWKHLDDVTKSSRVVGSANLEGRSWRVLALDHITFGISTHAPSRRLELVLSCHRDDAVNKLLQSTRPLVANSNRRSWATSFGASRILVKVSSGCGLHQPPSKSNLTGWPQLNSSFKGWTMRSDTKKKLVLQELLRPNFSVIGCDR